MSLLEVLVSLALVGILTAYGAPTLARWRQQQQLESAARHLALAVTAACGRALASGRTHAIWFDPDPIDLRWVTVVDGDGDGVGTIDLADGIDEPIEPWRALSVHHPGVRPGRPTGVPTINGGAEDDEGLAFGGSEILSCGSDGGARSGTLYLRSDRDDAAAVRLYGATGKLGLWWWDQGPSDWAEMR